MSFLQLSCSLRWWFEYINTYSISGWYTSTDNGRLPPFLILCTQKLLQKPSLVSQTGSRAGPLIELYVCFQDDKVAATDNPAICYENPQNWSCSERTVFGVEEHIGGNDNKGYPRWTGWRSLSSIRWIGSLCIICFDGARFSCWTFTLSEYNFPSFGGSIRSWR